MEKPTLDSKKIQYPIAFQDSDKSLIDKKFHKKFFKIKQETIVAMQERLNTDKTYGESFKGQFSGLFSDSRLTQFVTVLKVIACFAIIPLIGVAMEAAYDKHCANANREAFRKATKDLSEATRNLLNLNYTYRDVKEGTVINLPMGTPRALIDADEQSRNQLEIAGDAWALSIRALIDELKIETPQELVAIFAASAVELISQNKSSDKSNRITFTKLAIEAASYALKNEVTHQTKRMISSLVEKITNSTIDTIADNLNEDEIDKKIVGITALEGNRTTERAIEIKQEIYAEIAKSDKIQNLGDSVLNQINELRDPEIARKLFLADYQESFTFAASENGEAKLTNLKGELALLNEQLPGLEKELADLADLKAPGEPLTLANFQQVASTLLEEGNQKIAAYKSAEEAVKAAKEKQKLLAKEIGLLENKLAVNANNIDQMQTQFNAFYDKRLKETVALEAKYSLIASSAVPEFDDAGALLQFEPEKLQENFKIDKITFPASVMPMDQIDATVTILLGEGNKSAPGAPALLHRFLMSWNLKKDADELVQPDKNGNPIFTEAANAKREESAKKAAAEAAKKDVGVVDDPAAPQPLTIHVEDSDSEESELLDDPADAEAPKADAKAPKANGPKNKQPIDDNAPNAQAPEAPKPATKPTNKTGIGFGGFGGWFSNS